MELNAVIQGDCVDVLNYFEEADWEEEHLTR